MGIDNLTHVRKGERLSAYTVNALIDAAKGYEKPGNFKPGTGIRAQTLFYTDVAIPPYSIFPLINNATSTYDTFYAKYKIEKYNEDHKDDYVPGLFGTNGRLSIPANVPFFGYIITSDWDSPILVTDYASNKKECGFKNGSWGATTEEKGLYLNGSAPQGASLYYARRVYSFEAEEYEDKKFFGLYESAATDGGLNFTKCTLHGQRTTYDTDEQITAYLPPYIDDVEQGGYYLIEWFDEYECWVVVAGTCAEDSRQYQPYTTVVITYHLPNLHNGQTVPMSGTAVYIGQHSQYATLEYSRIWLQDIVDFPGRSENLFDVEPTFALNADYDEITYSGLKLRKGAAGIAVYQFVVTDCNGSCRDVYTVAFKCYEENTAPSVTINVSNFSLRLGQEYNSFIGEVTQSGQDANDTLVIYDEQVTGDTNILAAHSLTIDNQSKKIGLYLEASTAHTGTCQITFYVDDSHDLQATNGTYPQIALNVTVTNAAPIVEITQGTIRQEAGTTATYVIGTVSEPDGNDMHIANLRTVGGAITSANVTIDGENLKATITLASGAESGGDVYFKVEDEYGVYSSDPPAEQHIVVIPIPQEEEPGA